MLFSTTLVSYPQTTEYCVHIPPSDGIDCPRAVSQSLQLCTVNSLSTLELYCPQAEQRSFTMRILPSDKTYFTVVIPVHATLDTNIFLQLPFFLLQSSILLFRGARWLSGRVSDSEARGPGFETYLRRVVSLSKTLYSPKVLVNYPGSDGSVPT